MSEMIWIPSQSDAWEAVQVMSSDATTVTVRRRGVDVKIQGSLAHFDNVTQLALDESVENLVELESFNEGIILHHIRKRFLQDKIYTLVGNILIALNPYKSIDIYGNNIIDKIYQRAASQEDPIPHVFSIAATAVHNMQQDRKDQSILISGESGAGKTEATKKILQFISTVCSSTGSRAGISIENQILDSNPLLESFGNAKTIRNNNSSRFGKYMEVNFDKKCHVKGCKITAYLLEKSRVVRPGPDERNYHIFYMLLAGANKDMRREFALKPADQFQYLTTGNCLEIPHRSDAAEFEDLLYAMRNLNIAEDSQFCIFQCLAAVLHLGNLLFVIDKDVDTVDNASKIQSAADCRRIAMLLGLQSDALERALTHRESVVNGEKLSVPLSIDKATDQRDSLAKFVYARLFDYIVLRVNSSLSRGRPGPSIGVLDIFGFEVFKVNSFEQLCINYCNERLQTFFNEVIFENEMKLYSQEGLPMDDISYQDNIGCVRLIDLRGAGLFAYLDEEVTVPKGSDEKFVSKINQIFDDNQHTKSVFYLRNHKSALCFTVRHFAGDVEYDACGFLDKNRDALADSLQSLLASSTVHILTDAIQQTQAAQASEGGDGKRNAARSGRMTLCAKFKSDLDSLMGTLRQTVPHFIRCVKPNMEQVSNKFDASLALNQLKYSGLFEAIRIRKSGYEVRLAHDQFVKRYRNVFVQLPPPIARKIRELSAASSSVESNALSTATTTTAVSNNNKSSKSEKTVPQPQISDEWKEISEFMMQSMFSRLQQEPQWIARRAQLDAIAVQKGGNKNKRQKGMDNPSGPPEQVRSFAVGKTKVFLRSQNEKLLLDELREASRGNVVISLQRVVRGFLIRCRIYKSLGDAKRAREDAKLRERNESQQMKREDDLSMKIEQIFRSDYDLQARLKEARLKRQREEREKQQKKRLQAVVLIQRMVRGFCSRMKSRVLICEQLLQSALENKYCTDQQLMHAINRPIEWKVTSKLIQHYRRHAKKLLLQVMLESSADNQLQEAMLVQSLPLLSSAVKQAQSQDMRYLPRYPAAIQTLHRLKHKQTLLAMLENTLSQCVDMTTLLQRYDEIEFLLREAAERQLQGEDMVLQAAQRLRRIESLFALRQKLRHALEICSPTQMTKHMKERQRNVRLFGEQFLSVEANAVDSMLSMLRYQQTLLNAEDSVNLNSQVDAPSQIDQESAETTAAQRLTMHEIYKFVINARSDSKGTVNENEYDPDGDFSLLGFDLIYLPKFVRDPLQVIRNAQSQSELNLAIANYVKLVPNEFHRKFYFRVFKWTLAFGIWNKPNLAVEALRNRLYANEPEADNDEDMDLLPDDNSVAPEDELERRRQSISAHSLRSFATMTVGTARTGSPSKRSASPTKPVIGATMGRSVASRSTLSKDSAHRSQMPKRNVPFAERQAKSRVAAREILKSGSKLAFRNYAHQTDSLINKSLADIDKFQQSVQRTSKW